MKNAEVNKKTSMVKKLKMLKRIFLAILGITIIAFGLALVRYANLGVDPITILNTGVANKLGQTFGIGLLVTCIVFVIGIFIFDRRKIGFGTIYIPLAMGFTSDFFLRIIERISFLEIFSLEIKIAAFATFTLGAVILFTAGSLVLFFGAALYIETNTGLSPYDAIAIIIAEKINRNDWFKWVRIATDALCVIGGVLAGGTVGIGTLASVLIAGPLIAFYRKLLTRKQRK